MLAKWEGLPCSCAFISENVFFCSVVGKALSETAEVYSLKRGIYVGLKQENVPLSTTDLCFYAPYIDDCLKSRDFLSYGNSGHEQVCSTHCQHERDDVIHDDDTRQQRIINFRMMPPDDKKDDAFVIRLYNSTVVWLMNGTCYALSSVLSDIWKPRLYVLNDTLEYCITATNSFTLTTTPEGIYSANA